ncbi:MAG: 6-phosphogluconolactonase [Candidatus Peregrinibacteria bacterium]
MDFTQHATTSSDDFLQTSVAVLAFAVKDAIQLRGHCVIGLSGGSTPKPVYEAWSKERGIDWSKMTGFLIDERCVSADHADSNQRMIRECLPHLTMIVPDVAKAPPACADDYDARLKKLFHEQGFPDVITLGLGEDGHTASLFPPVPEAAFVNRRFKPPVNERFAIHTQTKQFAAADRISVTLSVLERSAAKIILLSGEKKRMVWEEMLSAVDDEHRWPLKAVLKTKGCEVVTWW